MAIDTKAGWIWALAQLEAAVSGGEIAVTADAASGLEAAASIQALAEALSARIKVLEDAAP